MGSSLIFLRNVTFYHHLIGLILFFCLLFKLGYGQKNLTFIFRNLAFKMIYVIERMNSKKKKLFSKYPSFLCIYFYASFIGLCICAARDNTRITYSDLIVAVLWRFGKSSNQNWCISKSITPFSCVVMKWSVVVWLVLKPLVCNSLKVSGPCKIISIVCTYLILVMRKLFSWFVVSNVLLTVTILVLSKIFTMLNLIYISISICVSRFSSSHKIMFLSIRKYEMNFEIVSFSR